MARFHPAASIRNPGLTAVPMFEAAAAGKVRALWIACTNPAVSMPDTKVSQEGLRRADLVIVQDCYYPTETSEYADVILPAAQWGEKQGTMTNSERLVVRSEQFLTPPGEAKPDWWIFTQVARAMGFKRNFDFYTPEEVWDEYRLLTAGTPCDQMGMTNERLAKTSLRWPCPYIRGILGHPVDTRVGSFSPNPRRHNFTRLSISRPTKTPMRSSRSV